MFYAYFSFGEDLGGYLIKKNGGCNIPKNIAAANCMVCKNISENI
jgi:hypothetical protein